MNISTHVVVIAALAVAVLLASCRSDGRNEPLVVATSSLPVDVQPTRAGPVVSVPGPLVTSNRNHMAFCASDTSGNALSQDDANRIVDAIETVIERVGEDNWPEGRTEYSLTEGCPDPPVRLGVVEDRPNDYAVRVEQASLYRVFIYLVPDDEFAATFNSTPYVLAAAEMLCQGDNCAEVTTALYVPYGISDDAFADAVHRAVGIGTPGDTEGG